MRKGVARCDACIGGALPCKGGGNKRCAQRHHGNQHIAAIVDSYGGIRTVVGTRGSIAANTRHDELCHVVPKLIVHEPIAWNDIPIVIERAKLEFEKWLDTLPNLTADEARSVTLYRLRQMEHEQESMNLEAMVET